MSLSLEKFKSLINTEDKLNTYAEFLNILDSIVSLSKVNVEGANVEFTSSVVKKQKKLKDICDRIYNGLRDAESLEKMQRTIDELEIEYAEFEEEINKTLPESKDQ